MFERTVNVNQIARESFFIGEQYRQYLLNKQIEGQTSLAQETSPDGQLQKRRYLKKMFYYFYKICFQPFRMLRLRIQTRKSLIMHFTLWSNF